MGAVVHSRAQPAQGHRLIVGIWMLTGSDQRKQTRFFEVDQPRAQGAHHSSTKNEWPDLLETTARILQHARLAGNRQRDNLQSVRAFSIQVVASEHPSRTAAVPLN